MKASELRIGNLLNYCGNQVFVLDIVTRKNYDVELGLFYDSIGFERKLSDKDVKPIPLTEDMLLRLGFDRYKNYFSKNILKYRFFKNGRIDLYLIGYYQERVKTKHIHQLQNLYFALTGEELELTAKPKTEQSRHLP